MKTIISNLAIALFFITSMSFSASAQTTKEKPLDMKQQISACLSQMQAPTPENLLNCIAQMEEIEAQFPDSVQPKYQAARLCLIFAVMNPQNDQADGLAKAADRRISQLRQMKTASPSDVYTLQGFYLTALIVKNPMKEGPVYYRDALDCFDKALQLDPNNAFARQLKARFVEEANRITGTK